MVNTILKSGLKMIVIAGVLMFFLITSCKPEKEQVMKLWYDEPAKDWNAALPLGNGRLGAMVFGHPEKERLQLNEDTFWAGGPHRNDNPDALAVMDVIRSHIFAGNYKAANKLAWEHAITQTNHGCPYLPVADVYLAFPGHENYVNYTRELDIGRAVSSVSYTLDGVRYTRESFISFTDQVVVMRLSADKPAMIGFDCSLQSPFKQSLQIIDDRGLRLTGKGRDHEGVKGQVAFCTDLHISASGGSIEPADTLLRVRNADEAVLSISVATNFKDYKTVEGDPVAKASAMLNNAIKADYQKLQTSHIDFYRSYFDRIKLDLGTTDASLQPTDERIAQFGEVDDPHLVSLYFQFGRYLLISSSQPGSQPANLQGIWNDQVQPPWDAKYTININTEMNYWPSEVTNLAELNEPLVQMVRELSEAGSKTAETMYGATGWVVHHNTDLWRMAAPIDGPWGLWPSGAPGCVSTCGRNTSTVAMSKT